MKGNNVMRNLAFAFEFDIEHFDFHDEHIIDSLSLNRIVHVAN